MHFQANFIPHDPGRHRVDVKFNGEKVPNSPWFVEVKDPNTPLLAPMLVANRGKTNGHSENQDSHKYSSSQVSYTVIEHRALLCKYFIVFSWPAWSKSRSVYF